MPRMIEPIEDLGDGVIGMSAVGQVTVDDYSKVVEPAVAELDVHDGKIRLLLFLGPEFTGFDDGAWADLTGELRHTHFQRGAVVTDDHRISTGINLMKWLLHGEVRTFHNDEYDDAVHWVST